MAAPELSSFESLLASSGTGWALAVVFAAGVGTSFTPCVYPLIPITVNVFGGGRAQSRGRAVLVSSSFVLGIATMFSSLGVVAALSGKAFGTYLASPYVVAGLAVFFVVMGASMLGLFELALPSGLQTRLSMVGGSGVRGAYLMGLVAGFVAAPCTGPVLAAVLTWVASTQSVFLGFVFLFTYALGVGLLFFVIGVFAVQLPKSGPWMDTVKAVFAIALFATALVFLRPHVGALKAVLPEAAWGWAVVVGLFLVGAVAGAFTLDAHAGVAVAARKIGAVALCTGAVYLAYDKVESVAEAKVAAAAHEWLASEGEGLMAAAASGKPLLIDFSAEWCAACKEMERHLFPDPRVAERLNRFVRVRIDATEETDAVTAVLDKYNVVGLPTVVFLPDGKSALDKPRYTGFEHNEKFVLSFIAMLDEALSKANAGK